VKANKTAGWPLCDVAFVDDAPFECLLETVLLCVDSVEDTLKALIRIFDARGL
jgi:hypothetical protein